MKLVKNIYKDMFLNKRVRFKSTCEIAPIDITGTVMGITKPQNETLFHIKSDHNGKTYLVGENQKNLSYQIM